MLCCVVLCGCVVARACLRARMPALELDAAQHFLHRGSLQPDGETVALPIIVAIVAVATVTGAVARAMVALLMMAAGGTPWQDKHHVACCAMRARVYVCVASVVRPRPVASGTAGASTTGVTMRGPRCLARRRRRFFLGRSVVPCSVAAAAALSAPPSCLPSLSCCSFSPPSSCSPSPCVSTTHGKIAGFAWLVWVR